MEFEWDESKRQSNLEKHGIDFVDAAEIWHGRTLNYPPEQEGGEERVLTIGETRDRQTIAVVWTRREDRTRIISARPAGRRERRDYHQSETG